MRRVGEGGEGEGSFSVIESEVHDTDQLLWGGGSWFEVIKSEVHDKVQFWLEG